MPNSGLIGGSAARCEAPVFRGRRVGPLPPVNVSPIDSSRNARGRVDKNLRRLAGRFMSRAWRRLFSSDSVAEVLDVRDTVRI